MNSIRGFGFPDDIIDRLATAFDLNGDGMIDFRDFVCGLSTCSRGTLEQQLEFFFKIFDRDQDGILHKNELVDMLHSLQITERTINLNSLTLLRNSHAENQEPDFDVIAENEVKNMSEEKINLEEFLSIAKTDGRFTLALENIKLIFSVRLGVLPQNPKEESTFIHQCFEKRVLDTPYVYLISSKWWNSWAKYSKYDHREEGIYTESSGVGQAGLPRFRQLTEDRPGPVDNSELLQDPELLDSICRVRTGLELHRHYKIVPESVWKAFISWYGGGPEIARMSTSECDLELFPFEFMIRVDRSVTYGSKSKHLNFKVQISRYVTITLLKEKISSRLSISTDRLRLWNSYDPLNMKCLDVQTEMNQHVGKVLFDGQPLDVEVQFVDGSWPHVARIQPDSPNAVIDVDMNIDATGTGLCGLDNLGNTCFLSVAMQCLSHSPLVTPYFLNDGHLFEFSKLKRDPLSKKALFALEYGKLLRILWSQRSFSTYSPSQFKLLIGKLKPMFRGYQQHDSEELLTFVLTCLHESLNRVQPATGNDNLNTSTNSGVVDVVMTGEDDIVESVTHDHMEADESGHDEKKSEDVHQLAEDAWRSFIVKDCSIIVDLFFFQVRSSLTCKRCNWQSHTFQPYSTLPLTLTDASFQWINIEVIVRHWGEYRRKLVKYGIILDKSNTVEDLLEKLSQISSIPTNRLTVLEIPKGKHIISGVFSLANKSLGLDEIKSSLLHAYEFPSPEQEVILFSPKNPDICPLLPSEEFVNFVFVHRTLEPDTISLFQKTKSELFGTPLVAYLPKIIEPETLAEFVWRNFSNMFTKLSEKTPTSDLQQLFKLSVVNKDGTSCQYCPWIRACPGCTIFPSDVPVLELDQVLTIAVDWDPEFLSNHFDPFVDESLFVHKSVISSKEKAQSFERSRRRCDLRDCFSSFVEPEEVTYKCDRCRDSGLFSKQLSLWTCPPLLIIQLKRFHWSGNKIETFINFPVVSLDVLDLFSEEKRQSSKFESFYELYAVSNHFGGNGEYGHYIAYINLQHDRKWYCFDDDSIREMDVSSVVTSNAYLLFYRRRDIPRGNMGFTDFWNESVSTIGENVRMQMLQEYQTWISSGEREAVIKRIVEGEVLEKESLNKLYESGSNDCTIL